MGAVPTHKTHGIPDSLVSTLVKNGAMNKETLNQISKVLGQAALAMPDQVVAIANLQAEVEKAIYLPGLRQRRLREDGWAPVSEALEKFESTPAIAILNQIDPETAGLAFHALQGYKDARAFFNTLTLELMEVGTWEALWASTGLEDE